MKPSQFRKPRVLPGTLWFGVLLTLGGLFGADGVSSIPQAPDLQKRPVTVADVIGMTRVGAPIPGYTGVGPKSEFAVFSPDGKRFAIVVIKGDLERNTNDYSLMLFRTAEVSRIPNPKKLITFSSASNDQGIAGLQWLPDNDTILFLGSPGTETTQLYSIQCSSGKVKKLTKHGTSLKSYSMSENGDTIVYAAETPQVDVINENVLRYGLHIAAENLADLIRGKIRSYDLELFLTKKDTVAERRLYTQGPLRSDGNVHFSLSPDGRHLLVKTSTTELPDSWRQYDDEVVRWAFARKPPKGISTGVLRYELVDTRTGRSDVLLDSPADSSSDLWSPDSNSVLLCGAYIPLDVANPVELQARRSRKFLVEIKLPSRMLVKSQRENRRRFDGTGPRTLYNFMGERMVALDWFTIGRAWRDGNLCPILRQWPRRPT